MRLVGSGFIKFSCRRFRQKKFSLTVFALRLSRQECHLQWLQYFTPLSIAKGEEGIYAHKTGWPFESAYWRRG
jgi:hypothetical protein